MTFLEVVSYLAHLSALPGFWVRLSIALIAAILLGFFIQQDWGSWLKIVMTFVVYLFFQEWLRGLVIVADPSMLHSYYRPLILTVICMVVFLVGVAIGVLISRYTVRTKILSDAEIYKMVSGISHKGVEYDEMTSKILPQAVRFNAEEKRIQNESEVYK